MVKSALAHFDDHFNPYLHCFQRQTRSVEEAAKRYLHGLFQCDLRNMEQMAEQVAGSHYQRLHHLLSESNWSRAEVRQPLIADANAHFGHGAALVFDVSGRATKVGERINNVGPSHGMWFADHRMWVWSSYPSQLMWVRNPS